MNQPMEPISASVQDAGERERWIALVVLCAGFLMIILDQTIVNVALPSIQSDLHFSQSGLAWVVNAYLIAFGGLLLLVGRLGDLIGRRRIFLAGLTVFTSASLVLGLAHTQALLIGARFVQGVGGAMTSALILGMIVTMFPNPSGQTKAIGVYSFVAAASPRAPGGLQPQAGAGTTNLAVIQQRALVAAERPSVVFDLATGWLREQRVLLPGAIRLERDVAAVRDQLLHKLLARVQRAGSKERSRSLEWLDKAAPRAQIPNSKPPRSRSSHRCWHSTPRLPTRDYAAERPG